MSADRTIPNAPATTWRAGSALQRSKTQAGHQSGDAHHAGIGADGRDSAKLEQEALQGDANKRDGEKSAVPQQDPDHARNQKMDARASYGNMEH